MKIFIVVGSVFVVICATIWRPAIFGVNTFLDGFFTFEILNILAVILTITLASVGHIHFSLNRVMRVLKNKPGGEAACAEVRSEINANSWLLVFLFLSELVILFLKGVPDFKLDWVISLTNGLSLVVLLTNVLVLYDMHKSIYDLVVLESKLPIKEEPANDGSP